MLAKRIIPCLDVKEGKVIKGKQFKKHKIIGDIISLSKRYSYEGADELVFYDITASTDNRIVDKKWVKSVSEIIDIPFCVAGGIKNIKQAGEILFYGADKISINSPALSNPDLINKLVDEYGSQCIVVSVDSWYNKKLNCYQVKKYTGNEKLSKITSWKTINWIKEIQNRGAGEIVLNIMNKDGECNGYDLFHLKEINKICNIPLIASGGAGNILHFLSVFSECNVDGALAASVFHKKIINIIELKKFLKKEGILVRL